MPPACRLARNAVVFPKRHRKVVHANRCLAAISATGGIEHVRLLRTRMHPSRKQAVRIDLDAFIELHGVLDQKLLQAALLECIEGFTGAADELAADEYLRDRLAAAALAQYRADLSAAIVALVSGR